MKHFLVYYLRPTTTQSPKMIWGLGLQQSGKLLA